MAEFMMACRAIREKCLHSEFSSSHVPVGFNANIYEVNLCILSKCGEIRTGKTPNTDTFFVVLGFQEKILKPSVENNWRNDPENILRKASENK